MRLSTIFAILAVAVGASPQSHASDGGCRSADEVVTVHGVAIARPLRLADGSTRTVWVLSLNSPLCVTETPGQTRIVRDVQIVGQPPPPDVEIELTGRLSTGNITQYYAVPTAIAVTGGRRTGVSRLPAEDAQKIASNPPSTPGWMSELNTALILFGALALYFFPTTMAVGSGHYNRKAIFVLNLCLGWTFIGWVVALVWANMRA